MGTVASPDDASSASGRGGGYIPCRSLKHTCPNWLQAAIADIEERVQSLSSRLPVNSGAASAGHSFAERAEDYYLQRPELIALLRDLHGRYLHLADRYCQALVRSHHRSASAADSDSTASTASIADSAVSFEPPFSVGTYSAPDVEMLIAELVSAWVQRDIAAAEASESMLRRSEASLKMELQASLLEVLESERLVLLGENARLTFRAEAAVKEAAAASAELNYMRHRALEMARLVVRLREEHRACVLGRHIEALQAQICEVKAAWESERKGNAVDAEKVRHEKCSLSAPTMSVVSASEARKWRWWERARRVEWVPCLPKAVNKAKVGCFGY